MGRSRMNIWDIYCIHTHKQTQIQHTHTHILFTRGDEHVGLDRPFLALGELGHGLGQVDVLGKVVEDVVKSLAGLCL